MRPTINPCELCIVRAVCRKECDKLIQYLSFKRCKTDHIGNILRSYEIIALGIRMGLISLYDDDKKWRWNNKTIEALSIHLMNL